MSSLRKNADRASGGITRRWSIIGLAATAAAVGTCNVAAGTIVEPAAARLIAAASAQIGVTKLYDASYQSLQFPGGDVPADRGVCTDVIVRAYRQAFGFDLQQKVNVDMRAHGAVYPQRWGLHKPDANIDHRRVLNLQTYFARQGAERPRPIGFTDWQPGDLVTQLVPANLPHIGIVSGTSNSDNTRLLVIHNIGQGTLLEDTLATYPITGRYRFFPAG